MMTPAQRRSRELWKLASPRTQLDLLRSDPRLSWDWHLWARDNQLPPEGDWVYWLILAGRGFGKTRTGAEWVRQEVKATPYVNLIGATADDARDIMIEGESGILAVCPTRERPEYQPSKRRLVWPNGAKSLIFTADEPERLRGKQHSRIWCDELAAWRYPEAWAQAKFGLRLGDKPAACITTTPRPTKLVKEIAADASTRITRGSTYDNESNLAPSFFSEIIKTYEGTRLGRQELDAEILDDNPGALWQRGMFDATRVKHPPMMRRVVVAIDPAVTSADDSDDTGIVVAGLGEDGRGYVLDDLTCKETPRGWAELAIRAYHHFRADRIVAEGNNGGDLIETVMRGIEVNVPYSRVHARVGKFSRAEPVAALYEQGRVSHVGSFPQLEDECCEYDPTTAKQSPNRMDALVWALTELMLSGPNNVFFA